MNILAHTCFIGNTGYANHARSFFTALNKYQTVRVRNLTIGTTWKEYSNSPHDDEPYITSEMKEMLILQTLYHEDGSRNDYPLYGYNNDFKTDIHIILVDANNSYYYDNYDGYKIAYNVWESTLYPDDFFKRLYYFDEVWVPSKWQFDCLVNQGYPNDKIFIVPEGVDVDIFKPLDVIPKKDKFQFLLFGRWEYRKSTTEILRTFNDTFRDNNNVEMICSIENSFAVDGLNSTEDRLRHHNIDTSKLKIINFPSRQEYINYLKEGNVFVSCSRSEGWNLPLEESLSCGTPSIYSNCSGQLEFAKGKGIPVNIAGMVPANKEHSSFPGEYYEPDFGDLKMKLLSSYNHYDSLKKLALEESKQIRKDFNWEIIAENASKLLTKTIDPVFITTGNIGYMPLIEKLVKSLLEFSNFKIIVYGIDCDISFDSPNMIKRKFVPPSHSIHDKWYWKQYACIESMKENYKNFIWIDGDVIVNHNIDNILKYFNQILNYPLSDIHVQEEFFGTYGNNKIQLFNEELSKHLNIEKSNPYSHVCFFIYNKNCKWFFEEIISIYKSINIDDYERLLLWNDEGIDNALRWKYKFTNNLPVSNFDISSYDWDSGQTENQLNDFYTFWNRGGPYNFNKIYGYQFIPKDKSNILYFHGNKNLEVCNEMIDFIKFKKNNSFKDSEYFYTDIYKLENLGKIKSIQGSTMDIASAYGWPSAIYHEIYNLEDYYLNHVKRINYDATVVDLGGNIGIFNRWAYKEGASKIISFEPDKRYFELLKLNSSPNSILFNAAVSDKMGEVILSESEHLGGSNIMSNPTQSPVKYTVRSYTLNYLFESGLITIIDFLKIDTEGAEQLIMKGISNENILKIKNITMEYHNSHLGFNDSIRNDLITRLNSLGFNSYLLFCGNNNALQLIYFYR